LGLTATPKRQDNADTYAYFGEPVFIYSLKEGINDGFLTPFKVKQIQTTLDEYVYTPMTRWWRAKWRRAGDTRKKTSTR
jgi:type I restriction enzyme, R subunit